MGHLLKIKCVDSRVTVHVLASTSVPFTLTTVQVTNLPHKRDNSVAKLRDRCDGLTSCQVAADTFRLAPADPCPAHARYLEAHYVCNSRTGSIERDKDTHWSVQSWPNLVIV
jgi:hypothetical protein